MIIIIIIFFKCNHKSLKSLVLSNKTRNLIDVVDIFFFSNKYLWDEIVILQFPKGDIKRLIISIFCNL